MLPAGGDADYVSKLEGGLGGVMTWYANVSAISSEAGPDGAVRQLAAVSLTPHRQVAATGVEVDFVIPTQVTCAAVSCA